MGSVYYALPAVAYAMIQKCSEKRSFLTLERPGGTRTRIVPAAAGDRLIRLARTGRKKSPTRRCQAGSWCPGSKGLTPDSAWKPCAGNERPGHSPMLSRAGTKQG
jgi:hypothetical protein